MRVELKEMRLFWFRMHKNGTRLEIGNESSSLRDFREGKFPYKHY
jgi:hypothetical protein